MKTSRLFVLIQRCLGIALVMALMAPCYAGPSGEGTSPIASNLEGQTQLDGTLYRKKNDWLLFVESDKAEFKKGSVQLVLSKSKKKQLESYLINQSYVTVVGKKTHCKSKLLCVNVDSIAATLYHPLNSRSGK
jgi:hypothetical protein